MTAPTAFAPVEFVVIGDPQQQGSKVGVPTKAGPRTKETNEKALKPWRSLVISEAMAHRHSEPMDGPLGVELTFRMKRPASRKSDVWCQVAPDIDKLTRAILDSLTQSRLIQDDARVAALTVRKTYGTFDEPVGVTVHVRQLLTPAPLYDDESKQ